MVTNQSGLTPTNERVTDTIPGPKQTLYLDSFPKGTWDGVQTITWALGSMLPGGVRTIHVYVHPITTFPAGTVITNLVVVSADNAPPAADSENTTITRPPVTNTPTSTPTASDTPTWTPWPTLTHTPTDTPTATETPTPTPTATPGPVSRSWLPLIRKSAG